MDRRIGSVVRVAIAALTLACAISYAATPLAPATTPAPAPETVSVADGAIPVARILEQADADERFLREIAAEAQQPDPADRLVAPLEALVLDIRKLAEVRGRDLRSLPALELETLEGYWSFFDTLLATWRAELQGITARSSEIAGELARRRAAWEATRARAAEKGLPEPLIGKIDAVLASIAGAEKELSVRLDHQLRLASRGNSVQVAVDEGGNAVRAASEGFHRRLYTIDAPPLFAAWTVQEPSHQVLSTLSLQSEVQSEFLQQYFAAYAWQEEVLAGASLGLLAWLLWARGRRRQEAPLTAAAESSAGILRRPISSWLVVSLLAALYFNRDAPLIVQELALFLLPIPTLRLLPRRVYEALGRWPYVVTGLYLLLRLGFVAVGSPFVERVYLLATGVVTLLALVWFLLRLRRQERASAVTVRLRGMRMIGWLFVGATLAAVIANVVGNVSLAEALTRGVIISSYMALVFYAAYAVLSAVASLMLAPPADWQTHFDTLHAPELLQSMRFLLKLVTLGLWVVVALKGFRLYQVVAGWASGVLARPLVLGQISITLGGVLLFVASVTASLWLAKLLRVVLRDEVLPRFKLPHGASNSIATLAYYAVASIGLIVALTAAGFEPSQLTIVVGALSVGIGFGLQNIVNNFVSGLILMFERPIQPGDLVEVSGTSGTVREIGMRATRLRTYEGADVVVPNGTLLSQNLLNWTLSEKIRRLEVSVSVAYGTDLENTLKVLLNGAMAAFGVIASPAPSVNFLGAGPNSLNFMVSAWTSDAKNWRAVRSNLTLKVYEALIAAGIEIPLQQQVLHLRSISPDVTKKFAVGPSASARPLWPETK